MLQMTLHRKHSVKHSVDAVNTSACCILEVKVQAPGLLALLVASTASEKHVNVLMHVPSIQPFSRWPTAFVILSRLLCRCT